MKIGIIGSGGIVHAALDAMRKQDIKVTALWCRDETKGEPLVEQYGIRSLYVDYNAFLKDETFDTVYCGLINNLHYIYCRKAIEAGKNVICEKPFTIAFANAVDLVQCAGKNKVMLFEGILSRYSANLKILREQISRIGELKMVSCTYAQYSRRYDDYCAGRVLPAFNPELSGGALYDINVYNIHMMTELFGMPRNMSYHANKGYNGIDLAGTIAMDYGDCGASLIGAKNCDGLNGILFYGTKGYLMIPNRPGMIQSIVVHDRATGKDEAIECISETDPMGVEMKAIENVIDNKDYGTMRRWMEKTLETSYILEFARKDAGLALGLDKMEI